MFFIRMAFWLCVVVMFLPAEPVDPQGVEGHLPQITAGDAYQAAEQAVDDISGICARNAELCETGNQIAQVFMAKARYGARLLYDYLHAEDQPVNVAQKA